MLDTERLAVYGALADDSLSTLFDTSVPEQKRVLALLTRNGVKTYGELLVRSSEELYSMTGAGFKTIRMIKELLADQELYLRELWRPKADAIRYTYRTVPMAPASTVLPLRPVMAEALMAYDVRTLSDFRKYNLDQIVFWKRGRLMLFTAAERQALIKPLVALNILKE